MTTMRDDFEALMPEPAGFRTRYRSEPEMIGYYPWTYADAGRRRRRYDRPECEYEDLFTADQMREAIRDATERAAKVAEAEAVEEVDDSDVAYNTAIRHCAAAIRGGERSKG